MIKIYSKLEKTLMGVLFAGALALGVMNKSNVEEKYSKGLAYPLLGVGALYSVVRLTSKYPKK